MTTSEDTFKALKKIDLPYFTKDCSDHVLGVAKDQIIADWTWFYKWNAEGELDLDGEAEVKTTDVNYKEYGELMYKMIRAREYGITEAGDTEDRLTYRAYAHYKGISPRTFDKDNSDDNEMQYYINFWSTL